MFVRASVSLPAMVAFCLGAIAVPLGGQTVSVDCAEGECHVVPLIRGSGGFVGRSSGDAEGVSAVLLCRGAGSTKAVTRQLSPDGAGLVSASFGFDDGRLDALFCEPGEDATLTITGLTEGGWYWLTDESNTAVAPLLSREALENRKVLPVNPGSPDIRVEANQAGTASFLKQLSTGRVGILHHVLPEPERILEPCGPVVDGELADGSPRYVSRETGCSMGDGGTLVGLDLYGVGGRTPLRGGRVLRPVSGETRVAVSLWLNRTGSVVHGDPADSPPTFGWPGIEGARPLLAGWEATLLDAGPNASLEDAGVELTEFAQPDGDGYLHLLVGPSEAYCPEEGEPNTAKVRVRAVMTTDLEGLPLNPVRPRIRHLEDLDGAAAEALFDVVCPQAGFAAAVAGVELIPAWRD